MFFSHSHFDHFYAQLLMIIAKGGIEGQLVYTIENPDPTYNEWDKCFVQGLYWFP